MMPHAPMEHLPDPDRQVLCRITAMLFEAFAEMTKGRLSEHYRAGRILKLILHGPHAERNRALAAPDEAFHLLAIVNHPQLARRERDWDLVRDRLRRAWEFGEITRPVRLLVESLERINYALIQGVPHYVSVATEGIALYEMEGLRLQEPRILAAPERRARGISQYARWQARASDFLMGSAFYRDRGNRPMAALMLHQACEHLYQCVLRSLILHGLRTHDLDQLREAAEMTAPCLRSAWPRASRFERHAFGCIRRAYIEVRYGHSYRISGEELAWAMECAADLHQRIKRLCLERLDGPVSREGCHV